MQARLFITEEAYHVLHGKSAAIVEALRSQIKGLDHIGCVFGQGDKIRLFFEVEKGLQAKLDKVFKDESVIDCMTKFYQAWGPRLTSANVKSVKQFIAELFNPISTSHEWNVFWEEQSKKIRSSLPKNMQEDEVGEVIKRINKLVRGAVFYKASCVWFGEMKCDPSMKLKNDIFAKITTSKTKEVIDFYQEKFKIEMKKRYNRLMLDLIEKPGESANIKARFQIMINDIQTESLFAILPNSQSLLSNFLVETERKLACLCKLSKESSQEFLCSDMKYVKPAKKHPSPKKHPVTPLSLDQIDHSSEPSSDSDSKASPSSTPETPSAIPNNCIGSIILPVDQSVVSFRIHVDVHPKKEVDVGQHRHSGKCPTDSSVQRTPRQTRDEQTTNFGTTSAALYASRNKGSGSPTPPSPHKTLASQTNLKKTN